METVEQMVLRRGVEESRKTPRVKQEILKSIGILVGAVIYSVGINFFLRPLELYSGGFMGFSQLITKLLHDIFKLNTAGIDLSGIIYFILNLPGLIISYIMMPRRFFRKTIYTIGCITALLTIIPISSTLIMEEMIANCLVAGIMAGIGIGIILRMGACDGGVSLIGMILIHGKGNMSVGKINIISNIFLYGTFLLLFDIKIVIYSFIYSVINALVCDKVHVQNINVQAIIITQMEDYVPLEVDIMGEMNRGITRWDAFGGYSGKHATVLMVVLSKYEITKFKAIVHRNDPDAFLMVHEGISVDGHYLKNLV